ncbi:MAG: putative Ser/Thr protein kinase [Myxococcota bacterium]
MLKPGENIDIWVVEAALGTGGMGSVYRCHNGSAKRILAAVKVLDHAVRSAAGAQERFVREAEILYQLDHPNIVKVRNVRIDSDPAYIEMEFVEGESLEKRLRRGGLPFEHAITVMTELADAVAYVHDQGVCHRDLKPANILIDSKGHTRIVDFGLALESNRSRLTQAGMTFGTVSYAPPEWITPEDMQPQMWDLYGLGVIFWEILTGRVAFAVSGQGSLRQQAMQVIMAKQDHPPLDPGARYHPAVRQLIGGMTHSDADQRYQTMDEVARAVQSLTPDMVQATSLTLTPVVHNRDLGPDTWSGELQAPGLLRGPTTLIHRGRAKSLVLGLGALLVALVAVASGAYLALQLGGPVVPATRDVTVSIGSDHLLPVRLMVGGQRIPIIRGVATLAPRTPGDLAVTWITGEGCMTGVCPGENCPSWCSTGVEILTILQGDGLAALSIAVPDAPARPVTLTLPERAADIRALVFFDTQSIPVSEDGSFVAPEILPGTHTVLVALGDCPDDLSVCPDDCPATCTVSTQSVVVSWDAETTRVEVDMPLPVFPVAEPIRAPPSGRFITHTAFARWLARHTEYQRDAAMGAGQGDANYLVAWSGTTPPAGMGGTPMINVSWAAANAYCSGRGGLPDVHAELPTPSSSKPMEYRVNAGIPLVLEEGSRHIPVQRRSDSNPLTSFRCAR